MRSGPSKRTATTSTRRDTKSSRRSIGWAIDKQMRTHLFESAPVVASPLAASWPRRVMVLADTGCQCMRAIPDGTT
jgi:hypothetical protein